MVQMRSQQTKVTKDLASGTQCRGFCRSSSGRPQGPRSGRGQKDAGQKHEEEFIFLPSNISAPLSPCSKVTKRFASSGFAVCSFAFSAFFAVKFSALRSLRLLLLSRSFLSGPSALFAFSAVKFSALPSLLLILFHRFSFSSFQ